MHRCAGISGRFYLLIVGICAVAGHARGGAGDLWSIGVHSGGNQSEAFGVNASGVVVGYSSGADGASAVLFSGGTSTFLAPIRYTEGHNINNLGTIVGTATPISTSTYKGFVRTADGTVYDAGILPQGGQTVLKAVNDSGIAVGSGYAKQGSGVAKHAVLYDGTLHDLGTLLGGSFSYADDVNASGVIVGTAQDGNNRTKAFRYQNGSVQELGLASPSASAFAEATGINDAGLTVGYGTAATGFVRALLFDASGAATPLTLLNGQSSSRAFDVNGLGAIVGNHGGDRATLWTPAGTPIDLDAWLDQVNPAAGALWNLRQATAINDGGIIVGTGTHFESAQLGFLTRGFVLDASSLVPEPLLAALLAPLFLLRRARRARSAIR